MSRRNFLVPAALLAALIVASSLAPGIVDRAAAGQASPAAGTPCPVTTEDENEALVRRYFEEGWNQGHVDVLDEVMAPTLRIHRPGPGDDLSRDDYKARIAEFRAAFPDINRTMDEVVTEGDVVVVRTTLAGTHQGEFEGAAASGRRVVWSGLEMVRIACGRITEGWIEVDALSLRRQLGIITDEELASAEAPAGTPAP